MSEVSELTRLGGAIVIAQAVAAAAQVDLDRIDAALKRAPDKDKVELEMQRRDTALRLSSASALVTDTRKRIQELDQQLSKGHIKHVSYGKNGKTAQIVIKQKGATFTRHVVLENGRWMGWSLLGAWSNIRTEYRLKEAEQDILEAILNSEPLTAQAA